MKSYLLFLIVMMINTSVYSQNLEKRVLYIISNSFPSKECKSIAFKIENNRVEVDYCYQSEINAFKSEKKFELDEEKVLKEIFELSSKEMKKIEGEIKKTQCDYEFPIQFILLENGDSEKIEWRRVNNCYPNNIRVIVKKLEKIFKKNKKKEEGVPPQKPTD